MVQLAAIARYTLRCSAFEAMPSSGFIRRTHGLTNVLNMTNGHVIVPRLNEYARENVAHIV